MEEFEDTCESCGCIEKVVGDIIVAMIKNGDMDQSDSTFEKRLKHTKEAVAEIYKTLAEVSGITDEDEE